MVFTRFIHALFLIIGIAGVLSAQTKTFQPKPGTGKSIEAYLDKLEAVGYSGSVLVAFDGEPVVSRGYGFSDRENKIRNSPRTIFDTGSITKQFTAAAILKLEMQGKLSTSDKITKYFEGVPTDKSNITIHDLLRHSSGLRGGIGGDYEKITETEFIEKVLASQLRAPTGTRFGYSNIGYSLLALIIENVSGQTYETYLYENLWKPARMETTGYTRPNFGKQLIAVGYRGDERWGKPIEKEWDKDAPFLHLKGNGGVLSTTQDLLRWDRALMSDRILSIEAKKKYYFPMLRTDETGRSHYAYGWDVYKTRRDTTRVWHNGSNRVFYADFYRFIDEGVTIILMTNSWQDPFTQTGRNIAWRIFNPNYSFPIPVPDTVANRGFTDEVIKLVLEKDLATAIDKFRARDPKLNLLEGRINSKGFDLVDEKKLKEAIELFKLNVFAFPMSAQAYDSLGEAHLEAGDKKSAIENYKKSVELDPENENGRRVLDRIRGN